MSRDRNNNAGTHLGAGFYFDALTPVVAEILLPDFELYTYFSTLKTEDHSHLFFLESLTGDENARYCILGFQPLMVIESRDGMVNTSTKHFSRTEETNILSTLRTILKSQSPQLIGDTDYFCGGLAGYWGYDLALEIEGIRRLKPTAQSLPDAAFFLPGIVVVQDRHTSVIRVYGYFRENTDEEQVIRNQIADTIQAIANCSSSTANDYTLKITGAVEESFFSNVSRSEFMDMVIRIKEHIRKGDVFQTVVSQSWKKPTSASPRQVYSRLRVMNPSPYMFYLHFPEFTLVGSSPEMLVKVEKDLVQTRPIAGTRPVTHNPERDLALRRELVSDAKEQSEHIMLVDLGRNDIGKVSQPGTVEVAEFMKLEAYSHVVHMVSVVKGKLKAGEDCLSSLKACFPAGTLTGAPKRRAMELINELEKDRRGPYGGAVGYVGWNEYLDSCIAIRSVLFRKGYCYIQAGAGIVADSVPENEYQETVAKARALMTAILYAEGLK
jgi:anthranilate synthase component 1